MRPDSHYTLGDNALAGDRLALLAAVFEPSTAAFVRAWAPRPTRVALDLGCGPGHTTVLVGAAAGAGQISGVEQSPGFVARARAEHPGLEVHHRDARLTPFPGPPPDLVFARFLLAHLPRPTEVLAGWSAALSPGSRLLLDEADTNESTLEPFTRYQQLAASMIAHHGGDLYVGRRLPTFDPPVGTRLVHHEVVEVRPPTAVAARLFAMNLATWRHDSWVQTHVAPDEIAGLAAALDELCSSAATGEMVFRNRQVVYERA